MKTAKRLPTDAQLSNLWLEEYADAHCTLCGNSGAIDTRGVTTAAGKEVGRLNYCICPNGRAMKAGGVLLQRGSKKLVHFQVTLDGGAVGLYDAPICGRTGMTLRLTASRADVTCPGCAAALLTATPRCASPR